VRACNAKRARALLSSFTFLCRTTTRIAAAAEARDEGSRRISQKFLQRPADIVTTTGPGGCRPGGCHAAPRWCPKSGPGGFRVWWCRHVQGQRFFFEIPSCWPNDVVSIIIMVLNAVGQTPEKKDTKIGTKTETVRRKTFCVGNPSLVSTRHCPFWPGPQPQVALKKTRLGSHGCSCDGEHAIRC